MSDPTQAGAAPQPGPDSYSLTDWIKILHNGAQVKPDHPQYTGVRQLMGEALSRVAEMHMEQNHADSLAAAPGPVSSFAENAAQGASLGLGSTIGNALGQGTGEFLAQTREAHPIASFAGNVAGGAVPATILAAMGVPGPLAVGGTAGVQAGLETKSPVTGALTGVGTAVGGKILGMGAKFIGLDKLASKAVGLLAKQFAAKTTTELAEKIGGMGVDEIRAALTKQKFGTPEQVEAAIAGMKKGLERTASGGVTLTARAGETLSPMPGTTKGFEVTGARATPPVPTAPTITEIQDRLAGARASYAQHTAESLLPKGGELPQPTGGATLTPKGGPKAVPADAVPEPFQASRRIAGTIQQLQDKMGRELTRAEKDAVLEKVLGAKSAKPGHPIWFGEGAPTPRGPASE